MDSPHIVFVGSVIPRSEESEFPLMSHASAQFQSRLLTALRRERFAVDMVVSVRQEPPRSRGGRLWMGAKRQSSDDGPLLQLPFMNIVGLKTITLAIGAFLALLWWSCTRRSSRRLILLYNLYPIPAAISLAVARLTGARVVAIVADLHVPGSGMRPAGLLHRMDLGLQTWAMPRLDGLVVLSSSMSADFAKQTPSIHVEGAAEDWGPVAATGSRSAEFPILYSGNLSEFRGVGLLLAAFAELEDPRYRLWITGRGDAEPEIRRAANDDSRITYFGLVERARLHELYAQAAVLVNPLRTHYASARYLFPSKVLEYMASGTPVISTAHADFDAGYREHLFILEDETPPALAHLIERVFAVTSAERGAFGIRAREFVLEKKNWTVQGRRLSAFLGEVLEH
ncbi:MAG: glycosyltransferase [Acidobacteriota bacterium]|nr:glycosyltransferase [Acidobacteriota bacterium]